MARYMLVDDEEDAETSGDGDDFEDDAETSGDGDEDLIDEAEYAFNAFTGAPRVSAKARGRFGLGFDPMELMPGGGLISQAVRGDIASGNADRALNRKIRAKRAGVATTPVRRRPGRGPIVIPKKKSPIVVVPPPEAPVMSLKQIMELAGGTEIASGRFTGVAGAISGQITVHTPGIVLMWDIDAEDGTLTDKFLTGVTLNGYPWTVIAGVRTSMTKYSYLRDAVFAPDIKYIRPGDTITILGDVPTDDVVNFSMAGIPTHNLDPEKMAMQVVRYIAGKSHGAPEVRAMLRIGR